MDDSYADLCDEAGFSLVELVVVVLILGVLSALAVPMVSGVERAAQVNAVAAVAASAAMGAAADIASGATVNAEPSVDSQYTARWKSGAAPGDIGAICVVAARAGTAYTAEAGPGC